MHTCTHPVRRPRSACCMYPRFAHIVISEEPQPYTGFARTAHFLGLRARQVLDPDSIETLVDSLDMDHSGSEPWLPSPHRRRCWRVICILVGSHGSRKPFQELRCRHTAFGRVLEAWYPGSPGKDVLNVEAFGSRPESEHVRARGFFMRFLDRPEVDYSEFIAGCLDAHMGLIESALYHAFHVFDVCPAGSAAFRGFPWHCVRASNPGLHTPTIPNEPRTLRPNSWIHIRTTFR